MDFKGKFRRFSKSVIQNKEECIYFPKDKDDLRNIIYSRIEEDSNCDLNDVWVGDIEDMYTLFEEIQFNGDISRWNVGNVKDMSYMFSGSTFNGDISKWDVSNVEDITAIFIDCPLGKNPPEWYKSKYLHLLKTNVALFKCFIKQK